MFFCFKQKTAYELRIRDCSSGVCSSDLRDISERRNRRVSMESHTAREGDDMNEATTVTRTQVRDPICGMDVDPATAAYRVEHDGMTYYFCGARCAETFQRRSEEHTSELQSLMRISYAVFCLTKKQAK